MRPIKPGRVPAAGEDMKVALVKANISIHRRTAALRVHQAEAAATENICNAHVLPVYRPEPMVVKNIIRLPVIRSVKRQNRIIVTTEKQLQRHMAVSHIFRIVRANARRHILTTAATGRPCRPIMAARPIGRIVQASVRWPKPTIAKIGRIKNVPTGV